MLFIVKHLWFHNRGLLIWMLDLLELSLVSIGQWVLLLSIFEEIEIFDSLWPFGHRHGDYAFVYITFKNIHKNKSIIDNSILIALRI